ncbi:MAG: amidohydrolase [bacterium]
MNRLLFSFSLFLFLCILTSCTPTAQKADLVLHNGTIHTVNDAMPTAEAVAVKDGKIVFVGSSTEAQAWIDDGTEVIDLQGKTATPGFIESHGHLLGIGYAAMRLNLMDAKNYDDVIARVAEAVKKSEPGEWILGRGWHQSKWRPQPSSMVRGFQTHDALSRVSPNNPVYLRHASGHAGFANAKAMEIAGVTKDSEFTEGGEIIKDSAGNPTGIFVERAQGLIGQAIPSTGPEMSRKALELAIEECLSKGITSFQDAGSGRSSIELYKTFLDEGKLKMRLWVMVGGRSNQLLDELFAADPEVGLGDNFLTIRAIKLGIDGALGPRGAWLLEPYSDDPGNSGHETMPAEQVYEVSKRALEHGYQVCVHAIGDRANKEVLDAFERAFKENPDAAKDARFRMEHAQILDEKDIPRFAGLGVIASMQGIHCTSDRPWAGDRLGQERIDEGAYVWQKLLQSGATIINGTDAPVEDVDPIASFYASVSRQGPDGNPPGGFDPDQKMTREQALRSYTLDAAYGGFEESIKGSIEVGKLADFAVFSKDIMTAPDNELLTTRVEYTIVGGKVAYSRSEQTSMR